MYFQILSDIELVLKLEQICLFFSPFVANLGMGHNKTKHLRPQILKKKEAVADLVLLMKKTR